MADQLKFKGTALCSWVRANNGIIEALFHPTSSASGYEYVLVNLRSSHGTPEMNKTYWLDIQPAFPHQ